MFALISCRVCVRVTVFVQYNKFALAKQISLGFVCVSFFAYKRKIVWNGFLFVRSFILFLFLLRHSRVGERPSIHLHTLTAVYTHNVYIRWQFRCLTTNKYIRCTESDMLQLRAN